MATAAATDSPPAYGLPPLPSLPCPDFRGPTPWSNWCIKGRLLAGAYPASLDDAETERILTTLLELGVNTFVCLQAEFSLHTPEAAWRSGQGLRPYIKDAQQVLIRARETGSHRIKQDKLDFLHLPIIDGSVTSDVALSRLADDCCSRLLRGERMYIHCWGGHGRTGTLLAVMLGRLYGVTCAAALRFTQAFHDSRKFPQGVRSPQTNPQVQQVKRLLPDPPSSRGVTYTRHPAVVLDDTIVRPAAAPPTPPKAPPSPAGATAASATTAAAGGLHGGAGGAGAAAAGSKSPASSTAVDMDVDQAPLLPPVPVNQQRKNAIRAKQGAGATCSGGSGTGSGRTILAAAGVGGGCEATESAAQQQQAAGLACTADFDTAAEVAAAPAPAPVGATRIDWLQSVFEKGQSKLANLRGAAASGGGIRAAPAAALPPSDSCSQQHSQHAQQQQACCHASPAKPCTPGSTTASSGPKPVINVHACSAASAAWGAASTESESAAGDGCQSVPVDMRPSTLTVVVPEQTASAGGAAPERSAASASSMSRMLGYLSGRSTVPVAHTDI
ncbi:hypothetical protein D9Q98_002945 [Chlorella vulgaris]|uniref:Tyrosine specific protein phosphatases domain-containing protein n=1 Tax=Chlorella vulgaris TaxID=3077 RepID=A0A9D4TUD4_CHLVU|nr:hypothetical protein D9Q98_002945 [Chlorella vulgaris]